MPHAELRTGFAEVYTNHDGKVSLTEFVPFVKEVSTLSTFSFLSLMFSLDRFNIIGVLFFLFVSCALLTLARRCYTLLCIISTD